MKAICTKCFNEKAFFYLLILIGLLPLVFTKYYLTLDGPAHIYSGNIIKELLLGNHSEFANLFKFNTLPVPNWISHFLFACFNLFFPDYISEKIVLGSYLILFPFFFRKIVLWFSPENKAFSYLGVLFAHNHLFYFGFYNMSLGLVALFGTIYFILNYVNKINFRQIALQTILFLLIYFSHIMILLVTFGITLLLPFASLKIEKVKGRFIVDNWNLFFIKLKVVLVAMIPSLILTGIYLLNVDSLDNAGRMDIHERLNWIIDVRPLLPLCYCADRKYFTHVLFALFLLMMATNLISDGRLQIRIPKLKFSLVWVTLSMAFTILFLIVPNSNLLPDRLIVLIYIFLCFWLASLSYPRWLHKTAIFIIVVIHLAFMFYHTKTMGRTSREVELMKEATQHIDAGSLLLPLNFASAIEWRHSHSSGYFGSGRPIAVIENYEGQLKWFPISWNMEGPFELAPLNVWAADNKRMIRNYYANIQNPDIFSLPQKDGNIHEIPYVVIYGKMPDETDPDYQQIKPILNKSYTLIFHNDFCWLYRLGKQQN